MINYPVFNDFLDTGKLNVIFKEFSAMHTNGYFMDNNTSLKYIDVSIYYKVIHFIISLCCINTVKLCIKISSLKKNRFLLKHQENS